MLGSPDVSLALSFSLQSFLENPEVFQGQMGPSGMCPEMQILSVQRSSISTPSSFWMSTLLSVLDNEPSHAAEEHQ